MTNWPFIFSSYHSLYHQCRDWWVVTKFPYQFIVLLKCTWLELCKQWTSQGWEISDFYLKSDFFIKDTIGNCQRPVFSLGVSQYKHKITNLWKFELDWSSELRDNNERKKHPCHTKLCFQMLDPQVLNLRSRNQISGKLLLSRKLHHFRGSRFLHCFIPSTSPHYSLPSDVLCR